MTGSPLVTNGLVVVNPGGAAGALVAYDEQTGDRVWSSGHADASYSSPQYADFPGRPQILNFNADGIAGHDASSGALLWSHPWVSHPSERNNVCQPVALPGDGKRPNAVFIASGYGVGCGVLELNETGDGFEVRERWRNRNLRAKFSSVVRRGRHVYGLDATVLTCIDLETGEPCWKGGRYGYGQLLLADDIIIVQAESGDVALVDASPEEYRERAIFPALDHRTWNHPVVSGDLLLVRNDREAACYQLPQSDTR
jgi:outer membrane protein assembly factor BamB